MQMKTLLALSMALPAWAQIQFTFTPPAVQAGQTYDLTWTTADTGPVSITLKGGSAAALSTVGVITTSGTGGSYKWTAPSNLANGAYAFQINSGTDINYSGFFSYTGGTGTAASAGSSAALSAAATGAASTALATAASTGTLTATGLSSAAASTGTGIVTSVPSQITSATTLTTKKSSSSASASFTNAAKTLSPGPAATATSTIPTGGAAGSSLSSPVALVFGAVLAMLFLQ